MDSERADPRFRSVLALSRTRAVKANDSRRRNAATRAAVGGQPEGTTQVSESSSNSWSSFPYRIFSFQRQPSIETIFLPKGINQWTPQASNILKDKPGAPARSQWRRSHG